MADDIKKSSSEDEYQFSDLDGPDIYSSADSTEQAQPMSDSGNANMKRNLLVVVGLILVSFAVYKLLGVFFSGKRTQTKPATTVSQPATPAVQPTPPVAAVTPPPPPAAITAEPNTNNQQLNEQLNQLKAHSSKNTDELDKISGGLVAINRSLMNLDKSISGVNTSLEQITQELKQQQQALAQLEKRINQTAKKRRVVRRRANRAPVKRSYFYIRAAIPGRAWLISSDEKAVTVEKGSRLSGYGRVTRIDSQRGLVMTSSGRIIRFSSAER